MVLIPHYFLFSPFFIVQRESDGVVITITIKLVNEVQPTDSHYMQFFNIVLRSAMEKLQLEEIRRNYYDPKVRYILSIHSSKWF